MSYKVERYNSLGFSGTAATVITPSIDISNFDRFSITLTNSHSTIGSVHIALQVTNDPGDTAANSPQKWFTLNSTTFPFPSAIGATAIVGSIPFDNAYRFLRVEIVQSATGAATEAGRYKVIIGGFQRYE